MLNLLISLLNKLEFYFFGYEKYARLKGVKIGKNCLLFTTKFGSEPFLIEIGDHVELSSGVSFITHDGGTWVFRDRDPSIDIFGKIKIGSNVYIGFNTIIMPGVTIGSNCVIGANSLVTKNIPDNAVVAGSPCRYICSFEEYYQRLKTLNVKSKLMNRKRKREYLLSLKDDNFIQKQMLEIHTPSDEM